MKRTKTDVKKENLIIIFTRLISSFLLASALMSIGSDKSFLDFEYVSGVNIPILLLILSAAFICLTVIEELFSVKGFPTLICAYTAVFVFTVSAGDNFYFTLTACFFTAFFIYFMQKEGLLVLNSFSSCRATNAVVLIIFIAVSSFTAYACVMRYLSYRSSNFDMGIFAQMFEYMSTTGKAETTSERNKLMSHFGVHFSPVLYSLLPFYMIFRTPAFLTAAQPFIVLSAVFPFMLILRKREKDETAVLLYCIVFLLFPAFVSPCYYDFHENIFFTPFLLWLLYFIERGGKSGVIIFTLLIFCVKEEVGLYTASIALYMIFGLKKSRAGIFMLAASLLHFFFTASLITSIGGQTLSGEHYGNMISDKGGILSMIKTVILSPAYTVSQMLDADKTAYIFYMFLPTLFLPFKTKKYSLFFLLIPLFMMNLVTSYCYQFDIHYQYGLASGALIMYMSAVNCENERHTANKGVICLAVCVLLCASITLPKAAVNINSYVQNAEDIRCSDEVIGGIPENASVTASSFLIPKLYKIKELYMLEKNTVADTDYVLIDKRYEDEYITAETFCVKNGYKLISQEGYVRVYAKQSS